MIIGAGIGGLAAAIALRQAGFEVEVYERAPELKEVGAGIGLSPNAIRALDYLGLMRSVVDAGTVLDALVSYNFTGEIIATLPTNLTEFPNVCLHRAELQKALASALPVGTIHLGHELVSIQNSENEVTAHFANGNKVSGDGLIGADGLRSRVRAHLRGDGEPVYRGYPCWRGVCSYPVKRVLTETFGLGVRVGIVPIGPRGTAWWCTANEPESSSDLPEGSKARLLRLLGNWHSPIPDLIEATDPSAIIKTGIYDRAPAKNWTQNRCTLLGDSAHPTTPNMGQGGCMAIEDAVILARCLTKYKDPSTAFHAYERARYSRTATVTRISKLYGAMGQWENPIAAWFRTKFLRISSGKSSIKGYLKFVNYDAGKLVV